MASQIMQWFTPYELFVAVGLGAAVIVALAVIGGRLIRSAAGQAAVWRIATVSMFLLLGLALTGLGQAVARLGRQWIAGRAESREAETRSERPHGDSPSMLAESDSSSAALVVPPSGAVANDFRLKPVLQAPTATETVGVPPLGGNMAETRLKPELQPPPPAQTNWLAAIWIAGTAVTLCWIIGGRITASRFRRRCPVMNDGELYERIADLCATFAIKQPVVLLSSPRTTSPEVFGGRRPAMVLPANFKQDFDRQQQEAILAHELAHLAAHDAGWQSAAHVLCGLLWWHPLVWWSRRQLRAAHEALADEGSLIVPDGPRVLAEALVALGQRLLEPQPRFGLSLGGGQFRSKHFRSGLGRRVERLLSLPQRPWRTPRRTRMAFVHFSLPALVALAAIFIGTAWAPSQVPITRGETTMSVLTTSWRGSLMATALCAMLGNSPFPAAADDDSTPSITPATSADREALQAKFHAIREKAAQLDEQGKHDEADRLRHAAKAIMSKSTIASGDPRVLFVTPGNPEQDKIMARLKEMGQKIGQLESEGKHDEAEHLKKEANELYGQFAASRSHNSVSLNGPSPERQKLYEQYKSLQQMIEKAKLAGNEDAVRQIMEQMQALQSKLRSQDGPSEAHYSTGEGELGARLKHLRAAAENLKAAGCEPEAKHVMDLIGHMEAEAHAKSDLSAYALKDPMGGQVFLYHDAGSSAAVQDLRSQIEEMRKEMRQMREELERGNNGKSGNNR